jgi:hypothetical protein
MAHDRSVEVPTTQIVIQLVEGQSAPTGELSVAGEPTIPFTGWIALIAALESVVASRAPKSIAEPQASRSRCADGD